MRRSNAFIDVPPAIADRLQAGGSALDLECGGGEAAIALALAFPRARVFGFDRSAERIARARRGAREAGLGSRVRFAVIDWTAMPRYGFDLIARFDFLFLEGAHMNREPRELDDWDDPTDLDVWPCGELVSLETTLDDELDALERGEAA